VFARHNQAMCDTSSDAYLCATVESAVMPRKAIENAPPVHAPTALIPVSGIQIPMLF
jgi:hypothetical protein